MKLEGYLSTLASPMLRGRARRTLEGSRVNAGVCVKLHALVERLVSEGYREQEREGQPALVSPEGSYYLQSAITRTGVSFARHLIEGRES